MQQYSGLAARTCSPRFCIPAGKEALIDGTATVGSETAQIHTGDAVPVRLNEDQSFANAGSGSLEFMIVGIARDFSAKDALMNAPPASHP